MASSSCSISAPDEDEEDLVVLECRDPEDELDESFKSEVTISTAEISAWDLSAILSHQILRIKASRKKLVEESSYFSGLLCGSFSESSEQCVVIRWSLNTFLEVVMLIYGAPVKIRPCSVLPLLQAALYFGVEIVLLECRTWFSDNLSHNAVSTKIQLDDLVLFWNYGIDHGINLITGLCTSYMARNFMWAMACDSFTDVPYNLLLSCIKHPNLTVNSERHLAEALLSWIYVNVEEPKYDDNSKVDWINLLKQIRVHLLPLWFLMGKLRCRFFSKFAEHNIDIILSELLKSSMVRQGNNDMGSWRIRLTEFTKLVLCSEGGPQA